MVDFKQLEKYLEIEGEGHREADLTTLNMYIKHYMLHVPFENINVQNKWPLALTDEAMMHKVVDERRGGFCYEMNRFFKSYLESKGYQVEMMSATVMSPNGWAKEGSHMSLKVTIENSEYVVDIGFGDMPKFALPIRQDDVGSKDVTGQYRVHVVDDSHYDIEKWSEEEEKWHISYRVFNEAKQLEDFKEGIAYNQYDPHSIFVKGLLITKATNKGRITMTQNHVTVLEDQKKTQIDVSNNDYQELLAHYFNIKPIAIQTFTDDK